MKKITSKNKIFKKKKKNLKTKSLEKPSKKNLEKKPLQNTKKNFGDKLVVKKFEKKKNFAKREQNPINIKKLFENKTNPCEKTPLKKILKKKIQKKSLKKKP